MEKKIDNLVPEQLTGSQMEVVQERKFASLMQAQMFFAMASRKLLAVNDWGKISGLSDFKIYSPQGEEVFRSVQEEDFIRINIPGPGPQAGGGFDWVRVEKIEKINDGDQEMIGIRVRPSSSPMGDSKYVAHFLKDIATSTFIIRRNRITVRAEEHGRNEQPNIDDGNLLDRGRNLIVGVGAKIGFSYPQWKLLVKGLLSGNP